MNAVKPRWTNSSFLLYLGAFVVLGAATAAYTYLSDQYGDAALVGWTLLMLGVLAFLTLALRRRGPWIAGGLFAYLTVAAFGTFLAALFTWWGWGGAPQNPFDGWHWAAWLLVVLVVVAAGAALALYRFPLLVFTIAILSWYLVTDILSGGGSWSAVVTLFVGFFYLVVALVSNRVYGFWLHVASGLLVAGPLVYWWHSSTADFWLLFVAGLVFTAVGRAARRSSWTVIGSLLMIAAAVHFSVDWTTGSFTFFQGPTRVWTPIVVFAVLGFIFVVLGLGAARREPLPE